MNHELINLFDKTHYLFADSNATNAKEIEIPASRGPQGSSIKYSLKVYCDEYYYGVRCTKYCREDEPGEEGNYRCNKRGQKICQDGYIWPNCTEKIPQPTTASSSLATTIVPTTRGTTAAPVPLCGGTVFASSGKIGLHGRDFHGVNHAHALVRCSWKIVVPENQKTKLYFTEFNLRGPLRCIDSVVTVDVLGSVLTFYCSDIPPGYGEVRVRESSVEVHAMVALDRWTSDAGFTLRFEPY